MISRIVLAMLLMLPFNLQFENSVNAQSAKQLTFRASVNYVPTGTLDFNNIEGRYDLYDNVFYRFAAEYSITKLFSIGPSFEILKKHIEPSAIYDDDILTYSFYADFRLNYGFTDSGKSLFVVGVGPGVSSLHESAGQKDSGFSLYGLAGFDLPLHKDLGIDFFYRYQTSHFKIEFREYKYDGSALQAGLNYRIKI